MSELEPFESLQEPDADLGDTAPVRGRRRRVYRLAWVLTAVLLAFGILPLYTVSLRLIELNKEALKTQQQVNQLQLASSLAQHLESFVEGQRRVMMVLAEALSSHAAAAGPDAFHRDLKERGTLSGFVDGDLLMVRYTHRDGEWVAALREGFEVTPGIEAELNEEFAQEMNTGTRNDVRLGTPFYCEPTASPAVLLSTPVTTDGRRIGVLTALVGFAGVWNEALKYSSGYTLFALDSDGAIFTQAAGDDTVGGLPYQELEIVREFVASGGNRVMPYASRDATGRPVNILGSYYQTRHGWGVFVQAEENLAYSFVQDMKWNTIFYGALAAVAAVVFGVLVAGWISRPIKRLADSSLAFAEADFSARVRVGARHEVGELAETFNVMAETLEKYIARIKRAAIENSQLFLGSIQALAAAIDEKDAYTRGHSERVRRYAVSLARAMGLSRDDIRRVEIGALLHDVGKIGIEDRILNKPGPLTREEYEEMKTHPVRGANIMGQIAQMRDIIPAMKHHHERWDGSGYPERLAGEEIPLAARVVTVADCWDAMTTNRPYQRAMGLEQGLARLQQLAGKVFDAKVVQVFVETMRRGEFTTVYREACRQVRATAASVDQIEAQRTAELAGLAEQFDPDCAPPRPGPAV